ncbi:hypothetical protein LguiB_013998 [Lonicera macranthoides]
MEGIEVDLSIRLNETRASWRLLEADLGGFGWVEIERLGFTTDDDEVVITILLQIRIREDEGEWSKASKL